MLQFIRDRAQGWLAWVIVGMIIVPFALWGVNQYVGGGSEPVAVTVNGNDITDREVQSAYYRQRQRLQQMFGENLPPNLFSEERLKKQTLDALIEERLIIDAAVDANMGVSDQMLVETIHSIDAFKDNGRFSNETYERTLRMQGMLPGMFETSLRKDLLVEQYRSGIENSDFISPVEKNLEQKLKNQKRDMGFVRVNAAQYMENMTVDETESNTYYQNNLQQFKTPEMVSVKYIELNAADLSKDTVVEEQEIRDRYESQIINYKTVEERNARHILLELAEDASAEEVKTVTEKIKGIRQQIIDGADFSNMAKMHSADPGSANEGGSLGFFGKGVMDPAFEQSVFALNVGDVSQPVRSQFGYHLIKLEEVKGGDTKPFNEVKDAIATEIRKERAEQQLFDLAEKLATYTYESPDTLEVASSQLNLPVKTSQLFSRIGGNEELTRDKKIIDAAYSDDVLVKGNNSSVIEINKDKMVVIRVNEHRQPGTKSYDEVKALVITALKREKAEVLAKEKAEKILSQLKSGKAPKEITKNSSLKWNQHKEVSRNQDGVEREIVNALFKMPHPDNKTLYQTQRLSNGDYAVIELSRIIVGDPDTEESENNQNGYATASLNAVMSWLKKQAQIEFKAN